jgi:hypothetical protein
MPKESNLNYNTLVEDSVLKIGTVTEILGKNIIITVDKKKNSSDLYYNGELIKNVSVGSYIQIRKGFITLIGKIDGEKTEKINFSDDKYLSERKLNVSLSGYLNPLNGNKFEGGLKELPLIGNEAYIVPNNILCKIYELANINNDFTINIGKTPIEEMNVNVSIDKLFSSHIAIFGNTGSGKSNTLAKLYSSLFSNKVLLNNSNFKNNCKFVLFDFNGEYSHANCISEDKVIYKLSTSKQSGQDKINIPKEVLLDVNIFSIISEATDKTQKPFIKRALNLYKKVYLSEDPLNYIKNLLKSIVTKVLMLPEKEKSFLLIDYLKNIIPKEFINGEEIEIDSDLEWWGTQNKYKYKNSASENEYFNCSDDVLRLNPLIYRMIDKVEQKSILETIIEFLYIQLVYDVLSNRANNEHIAPVINRLKSKYEDIQKVIDIQDNNNIWSNSNFIVIDLKHVNIEMKKILPLLISKYMYDEHKKSENNKILNIIIDEAHNILSKDSFRESESWKDYRLETFEEIIKEGRKFGVYITIASQRPADISETIISQAHNYFIHRLINHNDLKAISTAVSYIDKITEESIPTLPVGTCIFNGISTQMPIKITIDKLPDDKAPHSDNLYISNLI